MENADYKDLALKYSEKIKEKVSLHVNQFHFLIDQFKLDEAVVHLPMDLLFEVFLNYFADIDRLKTFHDIKRINNIKIASYEAYWWMKIKPIQVKEFQTKNKIKLLLINEYYAANTLVGHLFDNSSHLLKSAKELQTWQNFYDNLIYHFHHRLFSAQNLELALISLFAEPIYERK